MMNTEAKDRTCHHLHQPGGKRWTCCEHLISEEVTDYWRLWLSRGDAHHMVCDLCYKEQTHVHPVGADVREFDDAQLYEICGECWQHLSDQHHYGGAKGELSLLDAETLIECGLERIMDTEIPFELAAPLAMVSSLGGDGCYMLDVACNLWFVSEDEATRVLEHASAEIEFVTDKWLLEGPSPCGRFIAVCEAFGSRGYVVDVANGVVAMPLDRGTYRPEHTCFPVAFFTHRGETRIAHGTDWNRVDASDPRTGECLTPREPRRDENGRALREDELDFFNGPLFVSPDQKWIVNDGWVWQPIAVARVWNLERWLEEDVWEFERGESVVEPHCLVGNDWGFPFCFVDDGILASWGVRSNLEELEIPGITLVSTQTWRECGFIGADEHDCHALCVWEGNLYAKMADGLSVFSPQTGERIAHLKEFVVNAFCQQEGIWFRVEGDRLTSWRTNILYPVDADAE